MGQRCARLTLLALAAIACGCGSRGAAGRWHLDPDATVEANRAAILGQADGLAPDAALEQLRRAFDGARMDYELAPDGTFTSERGMPNISTGRTFERDESGVWGYLAEGSSELLFVVEVADGVAVSEERSATIAGERLLVETQHGSGTLTYVFERAD